MRSVLVAVLLTGAVAIATGNPDIPQKLKNTLTTIDVVPTKAQINNAYPPGTAEQDVLQNLAAIAIDTESQEDIGIRLRAIHALAKYCPATPCASTDLAHQSVVQVIDAIRASDAPPTGSEILLLRAAIETLGTMRVSTDVSTLVPLLEHPSRDIRAATARALRDVCNPQAITPLRARYNGESTDQVKLAISEALRILGQCSQNP
jgi:HEAT repeat protein